VRDGAVLAERWGPVELDAASPHFVGAEKKSNNTGELSAVAEALLWLADEDGGVAPAVLCYDSRYAAKITDGTFSAKANVALAAFCRTRFARERARRRSLTLQHVKGHSGDALNDRADALVQRGVAGDRSGRGADAPPPEAAAAPPPPPEAAAAPPPPPAPAVDAAALAKKRAAAVALRDAKRAKRAAVVDLTASP
jgi:ribonuclease HI